MSFVFQYHGIPERNLPRALIVQFPFWIIDDRCLEWNSQSLIVELAVLKIGKKRSVLDSVRHVFTGPNISQSHGKILFHGESFVVLVWVWRHCSRTSVRKKGKFC